MVSWTFPSALQHSTVLVFRSSLTISRFSSIIIGAGMSGLAMAIQLKRKLSFIDVIL